jgi:hypothetical protein
MKVASPSLHESDALIWMKQLVKASDTDNHDGDEDWNPAAPSIEELDAMALGATHQTESISLYHDAHLADKRQLARPGISSCMMIAPIDWGSQKMGARQQGSRCLWGLRLIPRCVQRLGYARCLISTESSHRGSIRKRKPATRCKRYVSSLVPLEAGISLHYSIVVVAREGDHASGCVVISTSGKVGLTG